QSVSLSSQAASQAAARLWVGKCAAAQGDLAGAQTAWQSAAGLGSGYYSYRAQDLLLGRPPFTPPPRYDFGVDYEAELRAAEDWLRAKLSLPASLPFSELGPILGADPRLRQAVALWQLGQYAAADAEFTALRQALAGDPETSLRLTALLHRLGHYQAAIFTARQALAAAGVSESAMLAAPAYFNHVRFGAYFPELVGAAATANKLDLLFMLAVIRQESLFAGFATSSAQARGLMQIIPATGEHIAAQLNWPGYSDDDLYRPVVSVQFGAYYLAEQLGAFDGDPYAALAAYNAGPGNAAAWKRLAPDDPDLFAEVVRYTETRNYIRYIYEVYAIYRGLYGE
ncbi:MAG: lytic transglycosylase domain-containing protein, partial [Chloroflexi bacterium]|nr:lytic transglycosylase domain-containing protein [Chloroflexota bacterium]